MWCACCMVAEPEAVILAANSVDALPVAHGSLLIE
jgi:hypothetical protein